MDEKQESAVLVTASERETVWFGSSLVDIIAGGEQTGGAYAIFEMLGPPGDEVPLHLHTEEEEAFLIIDGELTIWVGDQTRALQPGDYALMPRNVAHCYSVTSDIPARWLAITSPAGFEGYTREISTPATERRLPDPMPLDSEVLAKLATAAKKYGVQFLGAPGTRPTDLTD
ncbi:quercetin 2,3-dioxygenase [Nocardia sp. R16R-3T]